MTPDRPHRGRLQKIRINTIRYEKTSLGFVTPSPLHPFSSDESYLGLYGCLAVSFLARMSAIFGSPAMAVLMASFVAA